MSTEPFIIRKAYRYRLRSNRKGEAFRYLACGHTDHADVNAARNILAAGCAVLARKGHALVEGEVDVNKQSNGACATEPHAVRWAQRDIRSRLETEYSKWHWTTDATETLCGRRIMLIADGPAMLPETSDDTEHVDCKQCRRLLALFDQRRGAQAPVADKT
jgi:hypothetical protein